MQLHKAIWERLVNLNTQPDPNSWTWDLVLWIWLVFPGCCWLARITTQEWYTLQNYKTTKTTHHMNIALLWRKFCVCTKNFHIMNIDVPADVGTPPLNTQLPHVMHQFSELWHVQFNWICPLVPKIVSYNVIHSSITHQPFYDTDIFPCKVDTSLIYCIICSKCSKMYVGQTLKSLLNCHGTIDLKDKRKSTWPNYTHFSSRGHSFEMHVRILPLEHCPPNQLLSHEIHWIMALNTVLPFGLNSQSSITYRPP